MRNPFEFLKPNFQGENYAGRESEVYKVSKGKKIGEGFINEEVREVTLSREKHSVDLVRKTFSNVRLAQHSFEAYKRLRAAGFKKIPTTYRWKPDTKQIYMTNLEAEGRVIVTNNTNIAETPIEHVMFDETSLNSLLERLLEELCRAARTPDISLNIPEDSYFWLISQENPTDIDFCIADYDRITPYLQTNQMEHSRRVLLNFNYATESLKHVLRQIMDEAEYEKAAGCIERFSGGVFEKATEYLR